MFHMCDYESRCKFVYQLGLLVAFYGEKGSICIVGNKRSFISLIKSFDRSYSAVSLGSNVFVLAVAS